MLSDMKGQRFMNMKTVRLRGQTSTATVSVQYLNGRMHFYVSL